MADEKEELEPKDGEGTEGEGKQQEPKQEEPKSKEGEGKSGEGESIKEFDYQSECHCSKTQETFVLLVFYGGRKGICTPDACS